MDLLRILSVNVPGKFTFYILTARLWAINSSAATDQTSPKSNASPRHLWMTAREVNTKRQEWGLDPNQTKARRPLGKVSFLCSDQI